MCEEEINFEDLTSEELADTNMNYLKKMHKNAIEKNEKNGFSLQLEKLGNANFLGFEVFFKKDEFWIKEDEKRARKIDEKILRCFLIGYYSLRYPKY